MFKIRISLVLFILIGCSELPENSMEYSRREIPDQESWGVTITLTDEGLRRAVVKSGHLQKFHDRQFINLDQNVDIDFFDDNENHTSNLLSQFATVDEKTNSMKAVGQVIVVSDSGVTLFTDTLSWDNRKELVFTNDSVMVVTEEKDTLYGVGFESDMGLEYWKILKPSGVIGQDNNDD
ncbi:MAG: LPS export ABC transporter periplasmic protein LptC [Candidatus Marinimicrobia bacterium]|jgi:LPS export ABC transporter protein LptC|nr:LPS export ABC transporter periplasmic protein LptC [Candidatus Neomarinimicrobiota bacterium]MBT3828463.1 LPS export ABC transporter periplasmic protein LptC [Candidatus Neomarinimicrobiota bacterium]MBT3998066.1 LPS export ABC transporter periplasmic protein LptC [Candidatus Neomarinimicrobiota bacterium]MBT4280230.1 LPS export ABC transporter periplasmic protein LptC [Candidatus Neomarinimicrobiota bacterium]MBT4570207.1 LPS export ABC transporter periplasmic protein LptC [Candidatus Neom